MDFAPMITVVTKAFAKSHVNANAPAAYNDRPQTAHGAVSLNYTFLHATFVKNSA
jgi:hypothetical protein